MEDEDRSVQLNEEEKLGDDIEVRTFSALMCIRNVGKIQIYEAPININALDFYCFGGTILNCSIL